MKSGFIPPYEDNSKKKKKKEKKHLDGELWGKKGDIQCSQTELYLCLISPPHHMIQLSVCLYRDPHHLVL